MDTKKTDEIPKRKSYGTLIESLSDNEVMVFGSNLDGFHGAGAAGYASFGVSGNRWREFDYASKPDGWQGKWNVKGCSEGIQEGTDGKSYAIPTVVSAGLKRSIKVLDIVSSILKMYNYATEHPDLTFLVAGSIGRQPLNGYTHEDMCLMYIKAGEIPSNVIFSSSYTSKIFKRDEVEPHADA